MAGHKKYDDDANRLPSGMRRVGYDGDTQRYTFRQGNDLWLGEPGSLYGGNLKWAGRAPDAADEGEEPEQEECWIEAPDPAPPYSKELENAPSVSNTSKSQGENEWGVPVYSMSHTKAKPVDSMGPGTTLKRRASRFKEVASSTVVAQGVIRRLTRRQRLPNVPQNDTSASTGPSGGQVEGEESQQMNQSM